MKKNLLVTTALVAAFMTSNALADEYIRNQDQLDNIDTNLTFISFDNRNGEANLDNMGSLTLNNNLELNGTVTLHDQVTLEGGKNLAVNGWFTETASGSDVSGVDVVVNEGGLTLGNDLTVGDMTIGDGADITLYTTEEEYSLDTNKKLTVKDVLTFAGNNEIRNAKQSGETANTLTINGGNVKNEGVLTGNFTLNGGSYGFDVNEDATSNAYVDGTITLVGNVNLDVDVSNVTSAEDKLTFAKAVEGEGEWTHNLANNIFNVSISDGRNALEFAAKSAEDIAASTGASGSQAAGVNAIISGGTDTANESFNTIAGEVQSLMQSPNKADVAKALEMVDKMSSDLSNAVTASAVANNAQVLAAVGSRFTGGSVAPAKQGMSSGDSWFEKGTAWVQGLFNKSKLDTSNGFEADSEGVAFGFEKNVNDGNSKVGIGYAYTQSDIDADSRDVDADTHTLMVYGEYKPADWFVNGVLSYSFGDYDETSSIKSASYDVDAYGLQVMGGFEKVLDNGAVVTPSAGLRYLHVDPDSYTDSLGSKVDGDESDVITAVAGAKVTKTWELENGKVLKPEVRAALTYDLTEAEDTTVMTLANGSTYAVEGENLDRLGFEFGAGVSVDVNDDWELSVGYEGKFREDYQDHTGMLNAKYKF